MSRKVTAAKAVRAIRAAARKQAHKTVPQKTIDDRLAVCIGCPKIKHPEGFWEHAATLLSGGDYVCGVCHCGINLLIVTRDDLLKETEKERSERPECCWFPKLSE